ncbi:hypothetical protein BDV26DRAFT_271513 [Aspergillus bertholletiae]|uniref:Peptidase M10 metallopeptidase domain-containing protein n=1 Tax=Aspergillus bertholletiae TaxID=1226010 RepID=A0A5N7AXG8_9EURO|nr:hypothetical protein BDV26DRAFT_271513 [Aspergillus bertholletiae]
MATHMWNLANINITFQFVALAADADFVILHGPSSPEYESFYTEAFFPSNTSQLVHVYSLSFESQNIYEMWKLFLHELGHILGLRHEFNAQLIGEDNRNSVMSYNSNNLPILQISYIRMQGRREDRQALYRRLLPSNLMA